MKIAGAFAFILMSVFVTHLTWAEFQQTTETQDQAAVATEAPAESGAGVAAEQSAAETVAEPAAKSLTPAPAQDSMTELVLFEDLSQIFAVSKKMETKAEVPMAVYVVSREELLRWGVKQTYEIFGRVPGYAFYDLDFHGTEGVATRGLRRIWRMGFSYDLLPFFDWGHQPLAPSFIQSIEIARGPAGLAWGSSAEMGLMNITLRNDLQGTELSTEYGELGRKAYSAAYGHQFADGDKGDHVFVGYQRQQQSFKEYQVEEVLGAANPDWRSYGLGPDTMFLAGVMQYKPLKFVVVKSQNAAISRLTHANGAVQERIEERLGYGKSYQRMETLLYRLEYHILKEDNLKLHVYHNYSDKHWWVETFFQSRQIQKDWGFGGEWTGLGGDLAMNFGGDLLQEFHSNAPGFQSTWAREEFGQTFRDTGTFEGQVVGEYYPDVRNFYLQVKYRIMPELQAVLGGRVDWKEGWDPEYLFTGPRFGLICQPMDKITVKYLFNDTNRRPAANELYGGAEGIKAEHLNAHELVGIIDLIEGLNLDTTVYYQQLTDTISKGQTEFTKYFNGGKTTSTGVEWGIKYRPLSELLVYWNGSYAKNLAKGGRTTINGLVATVAAEALNDGSPLFIPEAMSFVGAEYDVLGYVKLNAALRSYYRIPYIDLAGNDCRQNINFVDITLRSMKFWENRIELMLSALNALDEDKGVPCFGEHAGTKAGLLPPKERRIIGQVNVTF